MGIEVMCHGESTPHPRTYWVQPLLSILVDFGGGMAGYASLLSHWPQEREHLGLMGQPHTSGGSHVRSAWGGASGSALSDD